MQHHLTQQHLNTMMKKEWKGSSSSTTNGRCLALGTSRVLLLLLLLLVGQSSGQVQPAVARPTA
jgi:hypothetical protein